MKKKLFITTILTTGLLLLALAAPFTRSAAASPNVPTDDFVITVKTDNPGLTADTQFLIRTIGIGYNYNVDCDDDGSDEMTGVNGEYLCDYGVVGTSTIRIKDNTGDG
jgi:hypothetical protein